MHVVWRETVDGRGFLVFGRNIGGACNEVGHALLLSNTHNSKYFCFLLRVICQQQQRWLSSFVFQKIQAASGLGLWATKERHLPKHGPAIFLLLFFFVDYRIINEPHQKQRGEGSDNKEEEEFFFSGGFFKQTGEREREREKV